MIDENQVPILVVENKQYYRELLKNLRQQMKVIQGEYVVSEDGEEIKFAAHINIVNDYINNELNDKKLLGKIYADLKIKCLDNHEQLLNINQKIRDYIDEIIYDEILDLEQEENVDPVDLFKAVGLKIVEDEDELSNFLQRIELLETYLGTRLHLFVNIREFFSQAELVDIYNGLLLRKSKFIIIESEYKGKMDIREKRYLIDEDLCEL